MTPGWSQIVEFARHIPPRQMSRRVLLRLRRAVEQGLKPDLGGPLARLAEQAPRALFAFPAGKAIRCAHGWRFEFLNRQESCATTIDWRLGGPGAANQLWRMNLHYFEWLAGVDDEALVEAIDQWTMAYPPYVRGADQDGWNAYALSLRVVAWLQELAARRQALDPDWVERTVGAVARQLRYLEKHLETDIGGNHLIKNIRALLWGAAAIEAPDAPRWRRCGLALLTRELAQILPDGMHFERSASYHAQVLGDLLDIRHALGGDPLGGRLDSAIARAAQVAADLTHADGKPTLFGDAGHSMAPPSGVLRQAARAVTGQAVAPRDVFDYPDGGHAGLRSGRDLFIVDAGPLGPDSLPGHAHGDIGSFEWSVAGERIIVDQGVFTYVPGDRRQASRQAWSHNTLAAPGADQGDFFGAFRLGRRCRLTRRAVSVDRDRLNVDVAHDGFVGKRGGSCHRRRMDAGRDEIVITDHIDRQLDGAAIAFLLAPGIAVREEPDGLHLVGAAAECRIASDGKATIEDAVWWPDMGVEIPTKRIRILLAGRHARTVLTVLARNES